MTGIVLGAAANRLPIVADGLSALRPRLWLSHCSRMYVTTYSMDIARQSRTYGID
jgi:hypothetical protein